MLRAAGDREQLVEEAAGADGVDRANPRRARTPWDDRGAAWPRARARACAARCRPRWRRSRSRPRRGRARGSRARSPRGGRCAARSRGRRRRAAARAADAILRARVEHHEIGMRASTASTLGREPGPDIGHRARGVGPHIPVRARDDARAGAEREEELGGRRDSATRCARRGGACPRECVSPKSSTLMRRRARDALAARCERAAARGARATSGEHERSERGAGRKNGHLSPGRRCPAATERSDARAYRHQPLLRGTERVARTRGVSWLRDPRSPSRHDASGSRARDFSRYSGGTAPESHRLP